jgi:hypothetical protein
MKINRVMQVVFVSASVCAALPAFAGSVLSAQAPAPLCGGDSDDDDDDDKDDDDKDGETRLCGGDSDDGDGDDGDDSGDDDGTETLQL